MIPAVAPRGWAKLAWQSDYGQFYLIDREDTSFSPPQAFGPEMGGGVHVLASGIVIYTADCLLRQICISIYAHEPKHSPVEIMSGKAWTRSTTVEACFPSRSFSISSPSMPDPLPNGPLFLLDTENVIARINWLECQDCRDDCALIEPDVVEISFWPNRTNPSL